MNTVAIHIQVANVTAAWLDREARDAGINRSEIASVVLEDAAKNEAAPFSAARLPPAERLRRFDEIPARVPDRRGPPADACRDRICD